MRYFRTMETSIVPATPTHLEAEGRVFHSWAIEQGATERKVERVVGFLNKHWMLQQLLPPNTWRKPGEPEFRWLRYLFRRHLQHILGWTYRREERDRKGFGDIVNEIIRHTLFPDPIATEDAEAEGDGAGGGQQSPTTATGECAAFVFASTG
jgi:hypothetical protein